MKESLEGERSTDPPGTYPFRAEVGSAEPTDQKGCPVVQSKERVDAVGQAKAASEEGQGPDFWVHALRVDVAVAVRDVPPGELRAFASWTPSPPRPKL